MADLTKQCTSCSEVKNLDNFHYSTRDGYFAKCKECVNKRRRELRAKKRAAGIKPAARIQWIDLAY